MSIFIIAEIGINHNGDIDIAKKLIDIAKGTGCDAVKFQKRTIEDVYSPEELNRYRESPWGTTTRQQKYGLEFGKDEYDEIDKYCKDKEIEWFASAWDIKSVDFLSQYDLNYNKIPSAMLTVEPMLAEIASRNKYTFISTGMSTIEEIDYAVEFFIKHNCPFELMHCRSTYPMPVIDANLSIMNTLRKKYNCLVGYSGHEVGLQITLAAAAMGATSIERHITLDRAMYGSDQAASVERSGLTRLVRDIRVIEAAIGNGVKDITEGEQKIREKLSKPFWLNNITNDQ